MTKRRAAITLIGLCAVAATTVVAQELPATLEFDLLSGNSDAAAFVHADGWGSSASCPGSPSTENFVVSACGSGANADCSGHPVTAMCAAFGGDGDTVQAADYQGEWLMNLSLVANPIGTYYSDNWGERVVCPPFSNGYETSNQRVVVAICGSGKDMNCDGKPASIVCAEMNYADVNSALELGGRQVEIAGKVRIDMSSAIWLPIQNFGDVAECPAGTIATGYCGSGENRDCNGNAAELQCAPIKAVVYID